MATVTTTTGRQTTRGFSAPCVRCGEADCVTVELNDTAAFHCRSCDNDFTAADVREILDAWAAVLAWCATAPVRA